MGEPVIVSAVRTAVARVGGGLAALEAHQFGAVVLRAALERAGLDGSEVDDVILGNVLLGGGNIARLTALEAGLPVTVPGMTVDRQCGSGLQAIVLAASLIRAGEGRIYLAGGTESMTRAPFLLERPAQPFPRTPPRFLRFQLAPEAVGNPPMGITAENVAERYGISREEQDAFALESHRRAVRAQAAGHFAEQIVPVPVPAGKGQVASFDRDEHPRPDTSLEKLAALPPVFKPGGTVTAGNACGINDGAAAVVVMDAAEAERRGSRPLGRITGWAVAGVDPNYMGIGPVPATRQVLERTGTRLDAVEVVELNEAFAAQALACIRELGLDPERVNPDGGAIALGHPLGATGAILVTKLLSALQRRGGRLGLVTACIGGGQGIAALIERL
ncbi:thiolase family protein [Thermaerobacter sp. PB12/4term]|uniref:thiolase family protein n=1 Tax=Thermaerobacter sp. PB12/4term TaxID=2293838 RepID=UPI000E32BEDF|nr:thiolase family protein [Thermaerobacter sp. PB12/4term]QIA27653.1 thiolase family protein [Thermaerobacter sp. PB12/4term]